MVAGTVNPKIKIICLPAVTVYAGVAEDCDGDSTAAEPSHVWGTKERGTFTQERGLLGGMFLSRRPTGEIGSPCSAAPHWLGCGGRKVEAAYPLLGGKVAETVEAEELWA